MIVGQQTTESSETEQSLAFSKLSCYQFRHILFLPMIRGAGPPASVQGCPPQTAVGAIVLCLPRRPRAGERLRESIFERFIHRKGRPLSAHICATLPCVARCACGSGSLSAPVSVGLKSPDSRCIFDRVERDDDFI